MTSYEDLIILGNFPMDRTMPFINWHIGKIHINCYIRKNGNPGDDVRLEWENGKLLSRTNFGKCAIVYRKDGTVEWSLLDDSYVNKIDTAITEFQVWNDKFTQLTLEDAIHLFCVEPNIK